MKDPVYDRETGEVLGESTRSDRPENPVTQPLYPEVTVHLSTGHDGSIGAVMGTVREAMRQAGVPDYGAVVSSMWAKVFTAESYTESLNIVMRYVTVT